LIKAEVNHDVARPVRYDFVFDTSDEFANAMTGFAFVALEF
jgi:hypothetical protein